MEKKIKVYRKNMVINDKEDAKQLSTKKADAVLGSCSGEQASNKKRERESLGSRVDASKRQKVADEQVNMERRCSVSGGSKNNAEPGTDMAREDGAEDEAGRKVAGSYVSLANEPESKPSHKLDEQSIERLLLMDNHDDDNEERQEVDEILVNVAGSGSIISEYVFFSNSTRLTCLLLDLQGSKHGSTGKRCVTSSSLCHEDSGSNRKLACSTFRWQF